MPARKTTAAKTTAAKTTAAVAGDAVVIAPPPAAPVTEAAPPPEIEAIAPAVVEQTAPEVAPAVVEQTAPEVAPAVVEQTAPEDALTAQDFALELLTEHLSAATASVWVAKVLAAVTSHFPVTISDVEGSSVLSIHRDVTYRGPESVRGLAESLALNLTLDVNSAILAKFPVA